MDNSFPLRKTSAVSADIDYTIARSARRRSVSIEGRAGKVVLRAPMAVADSVLLTFLAQKADWVRRKIAEQQVSVNAVPTRIYEAGARVPFMDQELTLVIGMGSTAAVKRVDNNLHVLLSSRSSQAREQQIKRLVSRWYQQQALIVLTQKTQQLCQRMALVCTQVTIKATRSKWGHCTSAGAIQYNWQILLAPEAIVDYLVAHEVSHLRHHNHSAEFWALVASVCPDFKQQRQWLKQQSAHLAL